MYVNKRRYLILFPPSQYSDVMDEKKSWSQFLGYLTDLKYIVAFFIYKTERKTRFNLQLRSRELRCYQSLGNHGLLRGKKLAPLSNFIQIACKDEA